MLIQLRLRVYYMTLSCFNLYFLVACNETLRWELSLPVFNKLYSFNLRLVYVFLGLDRSEIPLF